MNVILDIKVVDSCVLTSMNVPQDWVKNYDLTQQRDFSILLKLIKDIKNVIFLDKTRNYGFDFGEKVFEEIRHEELNNSGI